MKKVKILCVGIGGYANVYLESLLNSARDDFEIVGLVDISMEYCKFKEVLKNVPFYSTMEDFYKEHNADLCLITTPIHLHTRQILCALQNGSNVMCEKPLSSDSNDAEIIENAAKAAKKFVIIGYQWSYSKAINDLKEDVSAGIYGKPVFLKTIVLWPRDKAYFTRGSGWAGKLNSADGTPINDSIANNAAAHYLHNILYVTGGAHGKAAEVIDVKADLLRTNDIENFDTAVIKFTLDNGAEGLFVASHSTEETLDPRFEYKFTDGVINYDDTQREIIARKNDGTVKIYGNPFNDVNEKIYEAIDACTNENYVPPCGVLTAAAHVRCIEKVQKFKIHNANKFYLKQKDGFLFINGLGDILFDCYNRGKLLSDIEKFDELVK